MTGYDWFITLVAIPGMAIGFTGLTALWAVIAHQIWKEYR